jgi:16S rRNA (guanine527-N7)-methyltransferase
MSRRAPRGTGPVDPEPDDKGPEPAGSGEKPAAGEGTPEATAEAEVDDLAGRPDTPLASVDELRAALAWAFDGIEIESRVLDGYAQHARLLLERNREVNLTAIVEPKEMAAKHYLDSWRVTQYLPLYGKSVLDLGSGAGFPGLPIALADRDVRMTVLDSTQKRVDFLTESIAVLGLQNAKAVWARGEDHLARSHADVVLMRAVSSVRENVRTLRKVRHALKDLVMLKGPSWSREVRAAEREAERLGFKLDTVCEHRLPGEMGERAVLIYRAPGGQGR